METLAQQNAYLRLEIAATIWQLTIGMWLITALGTITYLLAREDRHHRLVMILIISGLFYAAREDYLMHRAAGYIRKAEQAQVTAMPANLPTWEGYKNGLASRYWFMMPIDLLAGLVWIYLFCSSHNVIWSRRTVKEFDRFIVFCEFCFVLGWAAPFLAVYVANK